MIEKKAKIINPAVGYLLIVECSDPLAGENFGDSKLVIPDEASSAMALMTGLVVVSNSTLYPEKTVVWFKKFQDEGLLIAGYRHGIMHESQVRASVEPGRYEVKARGLSASDIKQRVDAQRANAALVQG